MNIQILKVSQLEVSIFNVRKQMESVDDETDIDDLSEDIKVNGLLNPLTVRKIEGNDKYEVIAGQRRLLAIRKLNQETVSCNVLDVADQKAQELSLIENVQRNQMTTRDKIVAYNKLYEFYGDVYKVIKAVHITKPTLQKYIRMKNLPDNIISLLDAKGDKKITVDVAVQLSNIDKSKHDLNKILQIIEALSNDNKQKVLHDFNLDPNNNIDKLISLTYHMAITSNNLIIAKDEPFVFGSLGQRVYIPKVLYNHVIKLIDEHNMNREEPKSNSFDTENELHVDGLIDEKSLDKLKI